MASPSSPPAWVALWYNKGVCSAVATEKHLASVAGNKDANVQEI